jgi:osmotically-inducible protein OsmY
MVRSSFAVAALSCVILVLAGCSDLAKIPLGDYFQDQSVNSSVKAALAADKSVDSTRIDVETRERVVYLRGKVESEQHKTRAELIVFQVDGVRGVANQLEVQPAR